MGLNSRHFRHIPVRCILLTRTGVAGIRPDHGNDRRLRNTAGIVHTG